MYPRISHKKELAYDFPHHKLKVKIGWATTVHCATTEASFHCWLRSRGIVLWPSNSCQAEQNWQRGTFTHSKIVSWLLRVHDEIRLKRGFWTNTAIQHHESLSGCPKPCPETVVILRFLCDLQDRIGRAVAAARAGDPARSVAGAKNLEGDPPLLLVNILCCGGLGFATLGGLCFCSLHSWLHQKRWMIWRTTHRLGGSL